MSRLQRPPHAVKVTNKVAFHQCDPLAVAWHGRYFEWFEQARTALFASVELPVPRLREMGHRMYIVDAHCRYMAPLCYDEDLEVTAWFTAGSPLIRVAYDLYNLSTGRWSARATTVLATTDALGTLLAKTPDAILACLPVQ